MELELLENRRLLSGTVTQIYPGYFEVQGDGSNDAIDISVSQNNDTFTLDGETFYDVSYISIDGGGGDDHISVLSSDGEGSIGAGITGGDGNDDITLNFDGGVWAGSGNDVLHLTDSFRGEAYGEDGDDTMVISGACVDAEIQGGAGDDLIDCSNNSYSVVVHGGVGNDTIFGSAYNDQIYGDQGSDALYGNGGNDNFFVCGNDSVDGGDGRDAVYVQGSLQQSTDVEDVYYYN
jgi:Ca2+-binding RTX toxin-like protein